MDQVKFNSEVLEVRTGRPKPLGRSGVTSAIDKRTRNAPVWIGELGLEGDEQAETVIHGGPYQAVLQYALHHYDTWRAEFPGIADRFGPGGFGENIVAGIFDETNLCIGDTLRLGGALVRVTQSRQPCYKLNHRFGHPSMSRRAQESFRTGWFYSVIEPGFVEPGNSIALIDRICPEWPVARVQHFLYLETKNMEAARELAQLEPLAPKLRAIFAKRTEAAQVEGWEDRLWNRPPVDADESDWFETRVEQASYAVPGVKCFRLSRADGKRLPEFDAGAHIDVQLPNGLIRHYSLCNVASGGCYEIAIRLDNDGRGGSRYLHEQINQGSVVTISRPRNTFPAILGAKRHLMIAGGIGITPFLSMMRSLEGSGDEGELHYCARNPETAPFLAMLGTLRRTKVHSYFGGRNSRDALRVADLLSEVVEGTHVYCCGPPSLMDAVHDATRHWPARTVHFESFTPPSAKEGDNAKPFKIRIVSTGRLIDVAADVSMLDALRNAGVEVPSSCEAGTCGSCKVGYRDGSVTHRDYFLSASERSRFLTVCVSRATSDLITLEL
jgi:ferredoxin-NADP reductase/MOSC domain-containing protein YiiM